MILTDREIEIFIANGIITVAPPPTPQAYSSTSIDLHLSPKIKIFKQSLSGLTIDPSSSNYSFIHLSSVITEPKDITSGYSLAPHSLILGWTTERVELKRTARIAARVEGKSSLARLGVGVHITAPTIHAGFVGQIQLEIINHGPVPVILRPDMAICQLIFETTLGTPHSGYAGQFAGQSSS